MHWLRLTTNGQEVLGSDTFVKLDGRLNSPRRILETAMAHADTLKRIHSRLNGANYYQGSIRDGRLIRHISFPKPVFRLLVEELV